jgi:hypothetical protein
MSAKKFVPNKKGDVGMWFGSHPKSYDTTNKQQQK